jgi:hypothetical protein
MVSSCLIDDVLADPDLLALEFEAIVAANYPPAADGPDRTPPPTRRGAVVRPSSGRRARPGRRRFGPGRSAVVARKLPARERAPPHRVLGGVT